MLRRAFLTRFPAAAALLAAPQATAAPSRTSSDRQRPVRRRGHVAVTRAQGRGDAVVSIG